MRNHSELSCRVVAQGSADCKDQPDTFDGRIKIWDRCQAADSWLGWEHADDNTPVSNADDTWFQSVDGGRDAVVEYLSTHFITDAESIHDEKQFWRDQPPSALVQTLACMWARTSAFSAEISVMSEEQEMFDREWTSYKYKAFLVLRVGDRLVIDARFLGIEEKECDHIVEGLSQPNLGGLERLAISPEGVCKVLQSKVQNYGTWSSEQIRYEGSSALAALMQHGKRVSEYEFSGRVHRFR